MSATQTDLHKFFKVNKKLKANKSKNDSTQSTSPSDIKAKDELSEKTKAKVELSEKSKSEDIVSCNSTQTKLDPAEIKRRLGQCGRLDELRQRSINLKKLHKNLQEFRRKVREKEDVTLPPPPHKAPCTPPKKRLKVDTSLGSFSLQNEKLKLKGFDSIDIEVPVSPCKSPAKTLTPSKVVAYHSRGAVETFPDELLLPHRYQVLKEVFRAVDTVVSLLHNRQELVTFSKLKPAVQEMIKKTFSQNHLGQIKTVFPLAYFFSQEKLGKKTETYDLSLKPNFIYKKTETPVRNLNLDFDQAAPSSSKYRKLDSVVLVERRHVFHRSLLDILKKHHTKFLQTLDPPIELRGSLRRWHPEFPIEEVPVPQPSPLPQPPIADCPGTALEMLDKARSVISVNNRMKDAVETVAACSPAPIVPSVTRKCTEAQNDIAVALKGVSLSLLEKIRAREAAKAAREMTRSVESSNELVMLSRLPELARILRSLFVTEKKGALPFESVIATVVSSHSSSLSAGEAESHIQLLMSQIPGWCTSHKVRCGLYLKIDKSEQLQELIDKLNSIIKEKS